MGWTTNLKWLADLAGFLVAISSIFVKIKPISLQPNCCFYLPHTRVPAGRRVWQSVSFTSYQSCRKKLSNSSNLHVYVFHSPSWLSLEIAEWTRIFNIQAWDFFLRRYSMFCWGWGIKLSLPNVERSFKESKLSINLGNMTFLTACHGKKTSTIIYKMSITKLQ